MQDIEVHGQLSQIPLIKKNLDNNLYSGERRGAAVLRKKALPDSLWFGDPPVSGRPETGDR